MDDFKKTKEELIAELNKLRKENREMRLEKICYKLNGANKETRECLNHKNFAHLLSIIPGEFSVATDVSCKEIIHNPVVAKFLRIKDWESFSHSANEEPPAKVLRNAKELKPEEMPIQRSAWFGEIINDDELEFVWEDGVRKVSLWNSRPIYDENGNITGAVSSFKEITDGKIAERKLNEYLLNLEEIIKQRTEKLTKAYEKINNILESINDAFFSLDNAWNFTYINSQAEKYWGIKISELLGENIWDIYPYLVGSIFYNNYHQAKKENRPITFEVEDICQSAFIEVRVYPNKDGLSIYFCDITERKQLEKRLRLSEELFMKSFKSNPAAMSIKRFEDLSYVNVNKSFENVSGYSREEVLNFTPIELGIWGKSENSSLINKEIVRDFPVKIRTKAGAERIIHFSTEIIEIDGLKYILTSSKDFTELEASREREHQLAKKCINEAKKLNQLINLCPFYITVIDKQERITTINESHLIFLKSLGLKENIIGKNYRIITNLMDLDYKKMAIIKALQGEEITNHYPIFRGIRFVIKALPIRDAETNEIIGAMSIHHDITEYEKMKNHMIELDRLNLVSQMAAGVAHEIRNPMAAARGYLQLIRRKLGEEFKDRFDIVISEIDRVNSIITDFLSLAKQKNTEAEIQSLNQIINNIYPIIYGDAIKQGISAEIELEEDVPNLYANDKEIKQLILNLSRNAIESMGGKGKLTIQTRNKGGNLQLLISDTGCGVPKEQLEQIFTPFYTTKDNGTGLGLAICKSIIDRHNGTIDLESKEGKGTTFIITFKMV